MKDPNEKIVRVFIAPDNRRWDGIMIGLSDNGTVYTLSSEGRWKVLVPPLNYEEDIRSSGGDHE